MAPRKESSSSASPHPGRGLMSLQARAGACVAAGGSWLRLSTPDEVQVAPCGPVSGFASPGDFGHWHLLWGERGER